MKPIYAVIFITTLVVSCTPTSSSLPSSELTSSELALQPAKEALYIEHEKSFNFFWETTTTANVPGFGLSRDRWPGNPTIASIASVGFALAAIPSGVQQGFITREEGQLRVRRDT